MSINQLSGTFKARKGFIDYLNGFGFVCSLATPISRLASAGRGASLFYHHATFKGLPVFVKINCYKTNEQYTTYFQNRKLMEYLKSRSTSHHHNKILFFHTSEYSKQEIGSIFNISTNVVEYMKLNETVYVTAVEPLTEIRQFLASKQTFFHPIDSEAKGNIFLTLVVKLMIDFMNGIRELHSLGIIHGDLSLYNCQIKELDTLTDDFSTILKLDESPYFVGVLIDFNSSRLEGQQLMSKEYYPICTHKAQDNDDFFEKDIIPTISFTKAHDMYALSFVITHLVTILLYLSKELSYNQQAITQFVLNYRNPTDKEWILRQWEFLCKDSSRFFTNVEHLEIFSKLSTIVCEMFSSPWSFSTNSYFEKELQSIKHSLLTFNQKK